MGRGKEGLVSTACAVIIQILNKPIMYGYCLIYLPFDFNASCSTYLEMAGLDSSNFERNFEVAQATLSIDRRRPLNSVGMRLARLLVQRYERSGGHPVFFSACACSGYLAGLPFPSPLGRPGDEASSNQANFWSLILTNFYGRCAKLYVMQTNDQSRCMLYRIVGYTKGI